MPIFPDRQLCRVGTIVQVLAVACFGGVPTADAQTLSAGWAVAKVGQTAPGGANFGTEAISVSSSGAGVSGTADQFTFVYRPIEGDATVIARLATAGSVDLAVAPWAQAGLMIRESLASGSTHAFVLGSAANGVALRSRTVAGGRTRQNGSNSATVPIWLKLERRSSVLTAWRSADGVDWTTIGSVKLQMTRTVLVGLAAAGQTADGAAAAFSSVRVIGSGRLEAGYSAASVGSPALSGGSWAGGGTFILDGAGTGIAGTADQFRYVYKQVSGSQDIVARVAGFELSPAASAAGLMMRQALTAGAAHASLLVSPGTGVALASRGASGAATANVPGGAGTAPVWLKLSRRGPTITALRSADGLVWTTVGSQTVVLTEPFYVGLAVTSSTPQRYARATLDGVVLSAVTATNAAPTVSLMAPSDGATITVPSPVTLTATAADTDGTVARVDFYAGATLLGSDATSPYAVTWTGAAAGTYALKAVAVDNGGASTTSAIRTVTVRTNAAPNVSLTAPNYGAVFATPASVALSATASDSDGTVTQVEFYAGNTLLATDTTSPYAFSWSSVPAGAYSILAVARDNDGGMTVSSVRDITVINSELPSTVLFEPAGNHDAVDRYVLEVFVAGADTSLAQPMATQDLGWPAVVNNECQADVRATISALAPGNYVAVVSAVWGADGSLRSPPSPAFSR